MDLKKITTHWSYWDKPFPSYITRDVALPAKLDPQLALVIQGVRRCGKTTLLLQILKHYQLDPAQCLFINFEDPRLIDALNIALLDELVDFFHTFSAKKHAKYYFFFDEIQNVQQQKET